MSNRLFWIRHSSRGVSPVVANALMAATTVGMAGTFFLMVSNLISPYAPPTISFLTMQSVGTYASDAPGYCCLNDSFVQVTDIGGDTIFWGPPLQYQIRASGGDVIIRGDLDPAPEEDVYLGVYHGGPGSASIPVVGYIDVDPLNEVTPADTIQIYGMSEEYHDSTLQVLRNGQLLAEVALD